jgi:integrase/recombinase XerC
MFDQSYASESSIHNPRAPNEEPPSGSVLPGSEAKPGTVFSTFFLGRRASTSATYLHCLRKLARFLSVPSPEEALCLIVSRDQKEATAAVLCYKASLKEQGLAPATVNLYLSAIRSAVRFATFLGLISWRLKVHYEKVLPYRDTRGPGRRGVHLLLAELEGSVKIKAVRDRAIIRLMYDLALRVKEVACIDVEDLDFALGSIAVLGKGSSQKIRLTLPDPTRKALESWLQARGKDSGALFTRLDRARKGSARLTTRSIQRLVKNLGNRIGMRITPHGLRHAAITEALDLTNGNVRAVQRFSRHKDIRVLLRYDDNRTDLGGSIARMVAYSL